jgi:hypothetical protein
MLKIIPLLVGVATTAAIVQPSLAMNPAISSNSASELPSSNLHAQIILQQFEIKPATKMIN